MRSEAMSGPEALSVGWYGKIPGTGDFVSRRLPSAFSNAWDRWLQSAIGGSRERLGAGWRDAFLSMPVWRFVLSPGMLGDNAWAGIMVPSVDAVGRYFPLAVVSALPSVSVDLIATLFAAQSWFDEMEAIALSAIVPGVDSRTIDAAILRQPFSKRWLRVPPARDDTVPLRGAKPQMLWLPLGARGAERMHELRALAANLAEPIGAWLAEASEVCDRCLLLCEALPAPEQYCAMMDGLWSEHGWGRRDRRAGWDGG
jgi:type VI secretion system protein ImpM